MPMPMAAVDADAGTGTAADGCLSAGACRRDLGSHPPFTRDSQEHNFSVRRKVCNILKPKKGLLMLYATLPVLFDASENPAVFDDPANEDWVAVVKAIEGVRFELLARLYYQALSHFRSQANRPALPGTIEVEGETRQQALEGILEVIEDRKARRKASGDAVAVFVDPEPDKTDETLPASLRDPANAPPPLGLIVGGAGRPPCDALCLLRAFVGASVMGIKDNPTMVFRLLHSNPTFAHLCGFIGRDVLKQPGELTSRRLPSESVCEEFSEVMTRYGLWNRARVEQVRDNIATGAVEVEDTLTFDTTHIIANSHCENVAASAVAANEGGRPKHRKVPRVTKTCDCGREAWEGCDHPWTPTDQGAAVVVKGPTRIYWAHKASIAAFANSDIPIDARALLYAADSDGKTLLPHIRRMQVDIPESLEDLRRILADDAYRENCDTVVVELPGVRLIVPVHPRRVSPALAVAFAGIDRFTPTGVPICNKGHRFRFVGRDLNEERYIWVAPDDGEGCPVCASCPSSCTAHRRRHIRVNRVDLPQIDWEHPQHTTRQREYYSKRTGVERAIKRLKIDLCAESLTHRDALRVQAHLDRKLLALHLLVAVKAQR
jgi:hypothetical protein